MPPKSQCLALLAIVLLACTLAAAQTAQQPTSSPWTLVWSDEFNAPNGSPVDSSKWVTETGGTGWGNHELEYYTARAQNAFQQDGNLVIKVFAEKYTGSDGVTRNYTSARLKIEANFRRSTAASKPASKFRARSGNLARLLDDG